MGPASPKPGLGNTDARPLGWRRRAVEWLEAPLGRFLDFGCGECGLLAELRDRCNECHGVDVDEDKIRAAQSRFPQFNLHVIAPDGRTPYPDDHFDTIAIVEVIEHVPKERATLGELARVLKPGGRLLLTTPHRGWLTFLDVGNFKFVFPRLHRFIHLRLKRDHGYYNRRFVRGEGRGMVGDISVAPDRRTWHRHYTPEEIVAACPSSLVLKKHAVYFPAMRALMLLKVGLDVCTGGRVKQLPPPLSHLERRLSRVASRSGDQLVMMFTKREGKA